MAQPISSAYRAAITTGYKIATSARALASGQQVALCAITDGQVTFDRTAAARRSCDITLVPTAASRQTLDVLIPNSMGAGPISTFGNEIAPAFGWVNPATKLPELVPYGVFAIETVEIDDTGDDLTLRVTGYDRSWTMSTRKFPAPYVVTKGTRADTAISALVTNRMGNVPQSIVPTGSNVLPQTTFAEGDDPWASLLILTAAIGYEAFFDVNGTFVAQPVPNPATAPLAWSFTEDKNGIMTSVSRTFTRSNIFNDFTVSGAGTGVGTPVRARVTDTNPSSPTYIGGPFGDVPEFVTSSLVSTVAQATLAAQTLLLQNQGAAEAVTLTTVPMPFLDVNDVVQVSRVRAGINGAYVIDSGQVSLRHDTASSFTTRRAR